MTETPAKNPAAQALGKLGGLARAKALSEEERREISRKAHLMKHKRAEIRRMLEGMPTLKKHLA